MRSMQVQGSESFDMRDGKSWPQARDPGRLYFDLIWTSPLFQSHEAQETKPLLYYRKGLVLIGKVAGCSPI